MMLGSPSFTEDDANPAISPITRCMYNRHSLSAGQYIKAPQVTKGQGHSKDLFQPSSTKTKIIQTLLHSRKDGATSYIYVGQDDKPTKYLQNIEYLQQKKEQVQDTNLATVKSNMLVITKKILYLDKLIHWNDTKVD